MAIDLKLFSDYEGGGSNSCLSIYSWRPNCISLGYAQKVERLIGGKAARRLGWEVVKRPTGGGIVFHNEAEVTYSFVTGIDNPSLPKGLIPSYKKISSAIVFALQKIGIDAEILPTRDPRPATRDPLCFSYPAEYEVVASGRKIVGNAQKRGKRALLQQGSIFVRQTPAELFSLLKMPHAGYNAVSVEEILGRKVGFEEMGEALVEGFKEKLSVKFKE